MQHVTFLPVERRRSIAVILERSVKPSYRGFYFSHVTVCQILVTGSHLFQLYLLNFYFHFRPCSYSQVVVQGVQQVYPQISKKGLHIYSFHCVRKCLNLKVRISHISRCTRPMHSHTYRGTLTLPVCTLGSARTAGQGAQRRGKSLGVGAITSRLQKLKGLMVR